MMCQLGHSIVVNKEKSNASYSELPAVKKGGEFIRFTYWHQS